VQIESAEGKGTSIRLTFPIRKARNAPAPEAPKPSEVNRSLRVLCIDDEPMVCRLLNDCLKRFNHQVTVAPGGRQGLDMFRAALRARQPYQVVVTDLGMPEVDGQQVARSIKSESPSTPVILLTGWGTMIKDEGDQTVLVDAVVSKPPRIHELNQLLLKVATPSTRDY
jgi:CheY-like chemotaxis protein